MTNVLQVHEIRNLSYQQVWDFQEVIHQKLVRTKRAEDKPNQTTHHLIFCEHKPVFTIGKSGKADHLLAREEWLNANGVELFKINRGGDITFHGRGQWTVYPIIDMDAYYHDVHRYVRELEQIIMNVLKTYGISTFPIKEYTGVWTGADPKRKICAIGIHFSRWVSMHGLALNVNTDLNYFNQIIPCGIADDDKAVTSISQELSRDLSMEEVKHRFLEEFLRFFPAEVI